MTELADFQIVTRPNGAASVTVNSEDISTQIRGFSVLSQVGQPTLLNLQYLPGETLISGPGVVQVTVPEASKEAVRRFLKNCDPMALEKEVLERAEFDGGTMITALEVLLEWANAAD